AGGVTVEFTTVAVDPELRWDEYHHQVDPLTLAKGVGLTQDGPHAAQLGRVVARQHRAAAAMLDAAGEVDGDRCPATAVELSLVSRRGPARLASQPGADRQRQEVAREAPSIEALRPTLVEDPPKIPLVTVVGVHILEVVPLVERPDTGPGPQRKAVPPEHMQ